MLATAPEDVLTFWLGPLAERDAPREEVSARWWMKSSAFDAEIGARFGEALSAAGRRELAHWNDSPRGRLAQVVLLDQFSRNVHRNTAEMFAHDGYAVELALAGIDAGEDDALAMAERYFLYMPLMHAEDLALQTRCVALFEELVPRAPQFRASVKFATAHRDIIARFGRFPHRNQLLGRPSTEEEVEFLKQPGSSF